MSDAARAAAKIAGVIVAGGAARRMGGAEKALLPFRSGTLLDAVIARVVGQVSCLALNVPQESAETYRCHYPNYPLLFDVFPERVGPLAGVIVGLEWARTLADIDWLATFPCDTPFLPRDTVVQFMARARDAPVFARDGDRLHGVCAVWPLHCLQELREGVEIARLRSLHSAMEALGGTTCLLQTAPDAFFNVNTPDDLARAEEIARSC